MQYIQFVAARADTGAAIPYARAAVYLSGTTTAAALFDVNDNPIGNPAQGSATGAVGFAADDGLYDIQISSPDGTYSLPLIEKVQIADLMGIIGTITSGRIGYATWAALSGITGSQAGVLAEVPASDTGTHTDPVNGSTGVSNSGVYRWSTSPAGWLWLYPSIASLAAASATAAAGSAAAAATSAQTISSSQPTSGDLASASVPRMTGGGGAVALVEDGVTVGITIPAGQTGANAGVQFDYTLTPEEKATLPGCTIKWLSVFEATAGMLADKAWFNAPMQVRRAGALSNAGTRTRFEQIGSYIYVEGEYTVTSTDDIISASVILASNATAYSSDLYVKPISQAYRIETLADGSSATTAGDAMFDRKIQALPAGMLSEDEDDPNVFSITDDTDQQLFVIGANGQAMFDPSDRLIALIQSRLSVENSVVQYSAIPAPTNLIAFYGQSLSLGLGTAQNLTGSSAYTNVYMPNDGVQDATWTGGSESLTGTFSLATSIAHLDGSVNSEGLEPPILGAANQLASRMQYADILCANSGRGGYAIQGLEKGWNDGTGRGPYDLLVDQYQTYAGLITKEPIRTVLCWMQGESDANNAAMTKASYTASLLGILSDYNTDTAANAHLVTYQFSSHTMRSPGYNYLVGIALAELGETNDVSVALPMYFLDYVDGVHENAPSARLCGAYFGKAIDYRFQTGQKFQPLRPISVARAGAVITAQFHVPVGNLVVDTSVVSDPGHYGFEVFDGTSNTTLPIASVIVFGNTVQITLSAVPANPIELGYAIGSTLNGQPAGRLTGARGCLRDEDDTRAYFDVDTPLHNYCVMFRKAEGYGS